MEKEQTNPKKWFSHRLVVFFTCCALLVGLLSWLGIRRPDSIQSEVEAVGGTYLDRYFAIPPRGAMSDWKRVAYAIFYQLVGNERHSISISLNNTDVTDDWVRRHAMEIKKRPVHYLNFSKTKITDDAVAQLAGMASLGELHLTGTLIADQSMSAIAKIPHLRLIDLRDTSLTADGISQLSDHQWLQTIEIDGDVLTDESVTHFNAMPRLRGLRLKDFNNEQLRCLRGMKNIDTLFLTGVTDESLPFLLQLGQIKNLSLVDTALSVDSVETIRKTFPNVDFGRAKPIEKAEEFAIYQRFEDQRREKLIVFLVTTLVGGSFILFLGFLWRRRMLHKRRQHVMSKS